MKKSIAMFACALAGALLSTSCNNKEDEVLESSYRYTFSGFEVSSGSLEEWPTRAAEAASCNLLVVDVVNDSYVQKVERISSEDALADVTMELTYGSHTLYFVYALQPWATFDETALSVSWDADHSLGETWVATLPLNVTGPAADAIGVTLKHGVAYTRIKLKDAIPAGVSYFNQVLVGSSWTYNLRTQCGGTASTLSRHITIPASYIGQKEVIMGVYSFVPEGVTQAASYEVTAYDAQDVAIASHTFDHVPLAANQYVMYEGQFFADPSAGAGFQMARDDQWKEETLIGF